jgi:hypothetical protein
MCSVQSQITELELLDGPIYPPKHAPSAKAGDNNNSFSKFVQLSGGERRTRGRRGKRERKKREKKRKRRERGEREEERETLDL